MLGGSTTTKNEASGEAAADGPLAKIFVRDLSEKQGFHSYFLARDKVLLTGKNGKPYLSVFLVDKTGAVDARIWDNVEAMAESFQSGDVVKVKGSVQIFQGRKQVIVHRLEKTLPAEFDLTELVNRSSRSPEEMFAELSQFVDTIEDGSIRQLTHDVLTDPEIRPLLLRAAAAKTIHHAYTGGLIEHILSICGMMKSIHAHYTRQGVQLRYDLLIFGAIFHDIGKVWELESEGAHGYTDKGKLLGHMVLAVELVERKAARILGFSDETKDILKHIILSHHGRIEYGSPRLPMFLEAFIVAAVDDLDSKINSIEVFLRGERESNVDPNQKWSRFNSMFERHFLLKT